MKKSQTRILGQPIQINSGPLHSYNVLKYTLSLNLYQCYTSPYLKNFTASNIIQFRVDSTLNSIRLDAVNSSLIIDSVRLAGVSFTHLNNILAIQLDQTYNVGDVVNVKIYYRHKNVADDALYVKSGMLFTDCEPEGARKWFPCWDKPSDKAQLDLTAKVKANVKLGSNGYLADSTLSGDSLWYHWVSNENVATYLTVLTSKVNYKLDIVYWHKLSNPTDSIPIRFYYNSGENPSSVKSIIRAMATWYSQNFIEHPFPKNGFATLNDLFTWGGMENQTLTSFCPGCWSESLTAHEFAHQWFGDMITCSTWADIWLNEGFATWSEAFWYESYGGYADYKSSIDGDANSYLYSNPGWPISDPDWAVTTPSTDILFNYAITYAKGACVLHQLRYVLGDSLFFATLKTYCADPNLKFQSSTISDFNQKVNLVTGENYNWFFNEWIFQPNHPVYQNTYNFQNLGTGQWKVNFFARQVQTNTVFFKMPIEINVHFQDNTDTLIRVMNDVNNQLLFWTFSKRPVLLQFDPHNQIVLKGGSTVVGVDEPQQDKYSMNLYQNAPNPVESKTTISYEIPMNTEVQLDIMNIMGETVIKVGKTLQQTGEHSVNLDFSNLPSGIYFYKLTAGNNILTKKLIVSK
ncbi:MAG: T9SS type A sorting domain-containing protein [Bacteroidales bacterium]|nr:T9SS type A sorting domain-containing protein [Bacteroidales bacterium]